LKRSYLSVFALAAIVAGFAFGGVRAEARSTPAPSPTPVALPTATPEPPDKAIPRLLEALKANPNDKEALLGLVQQYIGVGRADLALPLTQKLLSIGARTAQTYYYDGYANEQLNRVPQAIADYEQASNLDPTNVGVLGSLTQMYLKTNRLTDAERVAKRSVTFNKTDRRSFVNLGLVYASESKFDDARVQFETAYAMDKSDVTPLLQIGQTYMSQNSPANAVAAINRAIAADPKNTQSYMFRADVYAKQHDIVNALASYELAITTAPDDETRAGITDREANFLALEKKNGDAEATYQRAIAKYPSIGAAHIAYGDYWNTSNQIGKAVAEWTLGLGPDGNNPQALVRLGTYNLRSNHPTQAVQYLKKLADVSPDPQSLALLGQAYTFAHDYLHAKAACATAYRMQPSPEALGCVAGADFEIKNYKESAAIFDVLDARAHSFLDQSPQLLFIAGKVYQQTKQPAKASGEYRRLLKLIRPGTPAYKQVQKLIADLSKASKATSKAKRG